MLSVHPHPHGDDDDVDDYVFGDNDDDGGDGKVGDADDADDGDADGGDEVVQNTALSDQSSPQIVKEISDRYCLNTRE